MEEWKEIEGYEGLYEVSNLGRVRSVDRKIDNYHNTKSRRKSLILKQNKIRGGYLLVYLFKEGKRSHFLVHRLVAKTFLGDWSPFCNVVNHKDEDPSNNCVENLEWCSSSYNVNYGNRNKKVSEKLLNRKDLSKKVYQYSLDGKLIRIWNSTNEAGRNGFSQGHIASCCRGKRKTHKGYKWKYEVD